MSSSTSTLVDYRPESTAADDIMDAFLDAMIERGLELYAAQEEAILEIASGKHVILNTPTGSGKSLVALSLHFKAICEGKRCFYTSPIKALVSEKFFDLCNDLGAENVGMMTGDASINRDAPIICCTAEILSNIALRDAEHAVVDYVVMDEFHYYGDKDRGVAWQIPLLTLSQTTFLLMSATLGDTSAIEDRLVATTGREVSRVRSAERPVPLDYKYVVTPIHETISSLFSENKSPVYVVNFTQRACAEQAQALMSTDFISKDQKALIKDAVGGFAFDSVYGPTMKRFILHGVGLHHAGLLPKYRLLVEQLSQQGLLKLICGTDTLGVGINIPIRTVLFSQLCKYDGQKTGILTVRDFKQIAGRAGRKGYDDAGSVVCQAPEHVIENLRAEARFSKDDDKKKRRKIVKKKPPERGYAHWDENTFRGLIDKPSEDLRSQFRVGHGMLLNLLQGHDDGYRRLTQLVGRSLDTPRQKTKHRRRAAELFRALRNAELVRLIPNAPEPGQQVVVDDELQTDFSLNHTLSLFLIDALALLDPGSETFSLDVLTLVEAILENPRVILMRQVERLKTEKVAELKAAGVEYEQRMEELEKIEAPKPLRDFIYNAFNRFREIHPWIDEENIKPKSIARDMIERYMTFRDFIKEYKLQMSEGLLLRHLNQTYKALVHTVPISYHSEEVLDVIAYFRVMLARVDSSLLEEWEGLIAPDEERTEQDTPPALDLRRDDKALRAHVRAELHAFVQALARQDYEDAAGLIQHDDDLDEVALESALLDYVEEFGPVRFDHEARSPNHTRLTRVSPSSFEVVHTLVDPEGHNEWHLRGDIDLDNWSPDRPLIELRHIGR